MRNYPGLMAIVYIVMGVLFINLAISWAEETVWNPATIALAIIATLDFGVAIRYVKIYFKSKKDKE